MISWILQSRKKLYHYHHPTYTNQTNILQSYFQVPFSSIEPRVNKPCLGLNYYYNGPILDQVCLISTPYTRLNHLETLPFTAAHTHNFIT